MEYVDVEIIFPLQSTKHLSSAHERLSGLYVVLSGNVKAIRIQYRKPLCFVTTPGWFSMDISYLAFALPIGVANRKLYNDIYNEPCLLCMLDNFVWNRNLIITLRDILDQQSETVDLTCIFGIRLQTQTCVWESY